MLAHDPGSALNVSTSEDTEGLALLKMTLFKCIQIHHVVSIISVGVHLRMYQGVDNITNTHHSVKSPSTTEGWVMDII
jgi:hypothetical protein